MIKGIRSLSKLLGEQLAAQGIEAYSLTLEVDWQHDEVSLLLDLAVVDDGISETLSHLTKELVTDLKGKEKTCTKPSE